MIQKNFNSYLLSALLFVLLLFHSFTTQAQDFITTWSFPSGTTAIKFGALTTASGVNYTWSASPSGASGIGNFIMTFPGIVTVSVSGVQPGDKVTLSIEPTDLRRFYSDNGPHKLNLIDVSQWGAVPWSSMTGAFHNCANLQVSATDLPNLSNLTDMSWMFAGASSFNQPIENWNTANVTNMRGLFAAATSFNQPIGGWNTTSVTDMSTMFGYATSFNQSIGNWNTANVTNMESMFEHATSFNQPLNDWNTAHVTKMNRMFQEASSFNQPIGQWNTANVTLMFDMFREATSFNQNINTWNTAQVTNMSFMFGFATSFNQPLNNWNTSNVNIMSHMFWQAASFNQALNNWNTANVLYMGGMFGHATSFNQNIGNWNTANVTDMSAMFQWASSFNQNIGNWSLNSINPNPNGSGGLGGMLTASGLDCKNYSATLIGWRNNNPTAMGLTLHSTVRGYGPHAVAARDALINIQGWTIIGDWLDEHCDTLPTPTCEVPVATTRTIACIEDHGATRDYHIHWDFPNDGVTHPCNYTQNQKIFSPSDPTTSVGNFVTLDEELLQNSVWHFEGLFTLNAPNEPLEVCWEIPFCLNSTGEQCNVAQVCPKMDNPQHNDDVILDCYDDNAPQVYCDNINADFSVTCDHVPGNGITHHITLNLSAVIPATANTTNCPNFSFYITTITGSFPNNALIRVDMLNVPPVNGFHHLNATVNLDWFDEIGIDIICLQAIVAQYDRCWPSDRNICQKRFCADFKDLDCPDDTDGGDKTGGEGRAGKPLAGDVANSNLSLAPNPASSGVTFQYDLPAIYQEDTHAIIVTDGVGTLVKRITLEQIKGEAGLDVSMLPNGVYQVSLLNQDKIITTRKMVVVKE